MKDRQHQVLELYRTFRIADQLRYYENAGAEFQKAEIQVLGASAVLFGLTAAVAALAGAEVAGAQVWSALAAIVPAFSTALTAYSSLYAFGTHSKLYRDAARALRKAQNEPVALSEEPDLSRRQELLARYLSEVEDVFSKEQGQWGQLPIPSHLGRQDR